MVLRNCGYCSGINAHSVHVFYCPVEVLESLTRPFRAVACLASSHLIILVPVSFFLLLPLLGIVTALQVCEYLQQHVLLYCHVGLDEL